MTSDAFTNEPKRPGTTSPPTVAYTLNSEDHLALYMFVYDRVRAESRRGWRFWGRRLSPLAGVICAYGYASGVGLIPAGQWQPLIALAVLGIVGAILLDTLWPGGLFSGFLRSLHQGRMMMLIRNGRRVGLFNPDRRDRVVLVEDGFIESNDLEENSDGMEVRDNKETRVAWSAVASIDVTDRHAIFTIAQERGYLILPRSAFASEASFQQFLQIAWQNREAANPKSNETSRER